MTDERPVIELKNVSKSFGSLHVLRDISLGIPPRQTTAIIGPSGTGKSVALKIMVGLLPPDQGSVRCFDTEVTTASRAALYAARRRFGMLFQNGALFDSLSVGENIAFPLQHHHTELSAAQRRERVEEVLELVDLPGLFDRPTAALSGGQRKRVGLARAIVGQPEVVLFDEPSAGLDPVTADAIDELILRMKEALGVTFVVISHDIISVLNVADHIAMLNGGHLAAWAPVDEFVALDNPTVQNFLRRFTQR